MFVHFFILDKWSILSNYTETFTNVGTESHSLVFWLMYKMNNYWETNIDIDMEG